jgi:hypothetical protein
MLLKIADNTIIKTNNIISIEIKTSKFPDTMCKPNPYLENDKAIFDKGYLLEFYMIGDIVCKSNMYNTKTEAETKLKEWVGRINRIYLPFIGTPGVSDANQY